MLFAEVERVFALAGIVRRGEDRVIVACSGGRDSVVLAHATAELLGARRVILAHVDHAVREGSALDAARVAALADQLGAGFRLATLPSGPADEARLRRLRYAHLEAIRREEGAGRVLTAHTLEDQAETVLLALVRSARLEALRGIEMSRAGVLRPMLRVSRSEVARYASAHGLVYADDPTNREPRYLRNRIRKELLPLLETRYRKNMPGRLAKLASRVGAKFSAESDPKTRGAAKKPASRSVCAIQFERRTFGKETIPDGKRVAIFDADVLQKPMVRAVREGDRIQPFGMEGRRKVRDLLRETRVPAHTRGSFPIVADEKDEVIWVPGAARSSAYPVTPSTLNVWVFWTNDSDKLQQALQSVTVEEQDQEE